MCPPVHFDVSYSINPWMSLDVQVDADSAMRQWERLREVYLGLGHRVEVIEPAEGLPDMVFTANAGVVRGDRVLVSNFTHPERQPESEHFLRWFRDAGYERAQIAAAPNEGEGDILAAGDVLLAGTGPRTAPEAHAEVSAFFDAEVVPLELVDPRFYHLDTALTVLDGQTVAYYPGAFSPKAIETLERRFPHAVLADGSDACGFGLNAMSDGLNVVMSDRAPGLAARLTELGFNPIAVDMGELLKAGGSAKCCTLEVHA